MSIEFKKVNYIYGENTPFSYIALKDVSLKIPQGSFTALIGHTGSGKSTLIQHINALLLPSNGEVDIDEFVIRAGEKPEVLKPLRKKAGLVFQFPEYQLFEETIEKDILEANTVIGEKISFRRFEVVEKADNAAFGAYLHMGGRIAVLTVIDGTTDEEVAKDVAMHIAAINPRYVNESQIPQEELEHEKAVLTEQALNEGKPANIVEKMVVGRLQKFKAEIALVDQPFVKDPDMTVEKFVASKGGEVKSFVRFEVGEGIEKREDNFADEVMSQMKN